MPKVSVIVPIYGVEKYIERCARSLFEQSLEDIEIIFIDDCTLDNSIEVLRNVLLDYPNRIPHTYIKKMPVNSGLPKVRQFGIKLATADYVIACDSDDYVDKEMCQQMYELAVRENLDLVQCDIAIVDDNKILQLLSTRYDSLDSEELKTLIIGGAISNSLCNKLVKRTLFLKNEITYPENTMDEDNAIAVQLAYFSKRLGYIKKPFYKAYHNLSSVSRAEGEKSILERFKGSLSNSKLIINFLLLNGYNESSIPVIKAKLRPKALLQPLLKKSEYYHLWKNTYPEINKKILFDSRFTISTRLKYLLIQCHLYQLMFNH